MPRSPAEPTAATPSEPPGAAPSELPSAAADGLAGAGDQLRQLMHSRLESEPSWVRDTVRFLGELLSDIGAAPETPQQFIARSLGLAPDDVLAQTRDISPLFAESVGAVLGDLITTHHPVTGPGDAEERQSWAQVELDGDSLSVPKCIALFFAAGTLSDADIVLRLHEQSWGDDGLVLSAHSRHADQAAAEAVLSEVVHTARGPRNLHRGRTLNPVGAGQRFGFAITPTPVASRDELVLDEAIWAEIDLNVAALTTHREHMVRLGLGTRRGILLSGPPGTGKTAIARLIAAELAGDFTAVFVDARSGALNLPRIYREITNLGPSVVVLEDLDLYITDRKRDGRGSALADLLAVLDGSEQYEDILTIATTNDPGVLDKAAIRSARFDSVIEIGYPAPSAAAAILRRYLNDVSGNDVSGDDGPSSAVPGSAGGRQAAAGQPGAGETAGTGVDAAAVVAALPPDVSGADLREIVRRTVLSFGPAFTTGDVLAAVRTGRWRAAPLTGNYL